MPAVMENGMGAKLVCFFPKKAGSKFPTHIATITLFDTNTGEPLALVDGRLIAEMRTTAVSAAVTKYLAPKDSKILTLLSSGVQAQAHLDALRHVYHFNEVRVWSRTPAHAKHFAELNGINSIELEAAVRGADVVMIATNSTEPILKGAWLKDTAHINSVGAGRPNW